MPLPRGKKMLIRVYYVQPQNQSENCGELRNFCCYRNWTPVPSSPVRSRTTIFITLSPLPNSSLITFPQSLIYPSVCWFDTDISWKGTPKRVALKTERRLLSSVLYKMIIWSTNGHFGVNKWEKMVGRESSRSMIPEFSYILYILYTIMKD